MLRCDGASISGSISESVAPLSGSAPRAPPASAPPPGLLTMQCTTATLAGSAASQLAMEVTRRNSCPSGGAGKPGKRTSITALSKGVPSANDRQGGAADRSKNAAPAPTGERPAPRTSASTAVGVSLRWPITIIIIMMRPPLTVGLLAEVPHHEVAGVALFQQGTHGPRVVAGPDAGVGRRREAHGCNTHGAAATVKKRRSTAVA